MDIVYVTGEDRHEAIYRFASVAAAMAWDAKMLEIKKMPWRVNALGARVPENLCRVSAHAWLSTKAYPFVRDWGHNYTPIDIREAITMTEDYLQLPRAQW